MEHGKVYAVSTYNAGSEIERYEVDAGRLYLYVDSDADFDDDGGVLTINDVQFDYIRAEPEWPRLVVDVSSPTPEQATAVDGLIVGDMALLYPPAPETTALVRVGHGLDAIEVEVPHEFKAMLRDGVRDDYTAETVAIEQAGLSWVVAEVVGRPGEYYFGDPDGPAAEFGPNGYSLFDVDEETGERYDVIARSRARLKDAQARLDAAEGLIQDAFDEIEIKPDTDYVEAAKQQAIAAAAQDAQAKADEARTDAIARALSMAVNRVPSIEEGLDGWFTSANVEIDTTVCHSGTQSARIGPGGVSFYWPHIPVSDGQVWRFEAWALLSEDFTGNLGMRPIRRGNYDGTANVPGHVSVDQSITGEWQFLAFEHTIDGETEIAQRFANRVDTGYVWLDDIRLIEVTHVDRIGKIAAADAQAKADEARTDASAHADDVATAAETAAKTHADAAAAQAKADALAEAATTAQQKANVAAAAAEAAAKAHADAEAAGAKDSAIAAAAQDAAQKAADAEAAAKAHADAEAAAQAQQAQANAIAAAAQDATEKADAAEQAAKDWAGADATSKAAEVMQKAVEALTAAQLAQATADNAIRTFYRTEAPWPNGSEQPVEVLGDMWFELGTGVARRWNGTEWQLIRDESIGEALAAAQAAQGTADRKITAYYQDTAPLEADEGDLWFDTDDNNKIRHRVGAQWVLVLDAKGLADAAEQAAKDHADDAAAGAEQRAKAYAVTQADGVSKQFSSTALPGTTRAPAGSTWYRVDSAGRILSVFNQIAEPNGTNWVARPITSEAIDNVDIGILTVGSGTIRQAVVNQMSVQLADIIEANIGNLTVTGDTHLNNVVAQRVAGDIGSYVRIEVGQLLAGAIKVEVNLTAGGKIVAGSPTGRAAELSHDGLALFKVNDEGVRVPSTILGGPGADELALIDDDGDVLAGIGSDGYISGSGLTVNEDIEVGGLSLLGNFTDDVEEEADDGWFDKLPWGLVARLTASSSSPARPSGEEWGYVQIPFTALPGRMYEVLTTVGGKTSQNMRFYHRIRTGGGEATVNDPIDNFVDVVGGGNEAGDSIIRSMLAYSEQTEVSILVSYRGFAGASATAQRAKVNIYDVGPYIPNTGKYSTGGATGSGGGTPDPEPAPAKTYKSTWRASHWRVFYGSGAQRSSPDLVQGYTPYYPAGGINSSAILFLNGAIGGDNQGKTVSQVLSGATVDKVEIFLYYNHWHNSAGGTARLGKLGRNSLPATLKASPTKNVSGWRAGQGRWVTVPKSWFTDSNRGITIGGGTSTSTAYYGRADNGAANYISRRPRLRITYTK